MAAHEGEFAIIRMCQALDIQRSSYYAWRKREPSVRAQQNQVLVEEIKKIHSDSRQTYGSPRIHATLRQKGILCGKNRVADLMRIHRIAGKKPKRRVPITTQRRSGVVAAPNLLNQDFTVSAPNLKWVTDITYIDTAQGWLYLAPVMDLYSRMIVGWAMADHMQATLVEDALNMALARRRPGSNLLHHSDQGSQYTSYAYQALIQAHEIQVSMSRVGNCYDNAVMESFFSTLKTECVLGQFSNYAQARTTIFEYIEIWYNRQRLHSSLGYLSPAVFEQNHGH